MIQASPFDSTLYGRLLADEEAGAWLNDKAHLSAMLRVEGELAQAQSDAGLIPTDAAAAIARAAAKLQPNLGKLAEGTASAGVPVPALVKALKEALPPDQARWVHYGATSQDIVDTALVLNIRELLQLYEVRYRSIVSALSQLADEHRGTLVSGRTRTQQAAPVSFGLKVAQWLAPLMRHVEQLTALRERVLKLQLGGAVGTLSAMGDKAERIAQNLAERLDLACGPSWHTQRDSLLELSNWLTLTTGTLGKMAQDWLWMSQSEVGEIRFSNGGGSSTMPQKCNPVNAEVIVALARNNAGLVSQMHQAALQEHERSGSGWTQEWFVLPQQLMATAVAMKHGLEGLRFIEINSDRMQQNLDAYNGVIYAEAATFELAHSMTRDEAAKLVKQAAREAVNGERHLFDLIAERSEHALDLDRIRHQLLNSGATQAWLDQILAQANNLSNVR